MAICNSLSDNCPKSCKHATPHEPVIWENFFEAPNCVTKENVCYRGRNYRKVCKCV